MKNLLLTFLTIALFINCSKNDVEESVSDPLRIHYSFNGDILNKANDENNGMQFGVVSYVEDRKGNPSGALKLDGLDDRIKFNNPIKDSNINAYSISAWFKTGERFAGDQVVVLRGETITNIRIFKVDSETSKVCFDNVIGSGWKINCFDIVNNDWFHVVGVYRKDIGSKLYINGNLVSEVAFSGKMGSDFTIDSHLGAIIRDQVSTEPNTFWDGYMDEFKIFAKELTPSEIIDLYFE